MCVLYSGYIKSVPRRTGGKRFPPRNLTIVKHRHFGTQNMYDYFYTPCSSDVANKARALSILLSKQI